MVNSTDNSGPGPLTKETREGQFINCSLGDDNNKHNMIVLHSNSGAGTDMILTTKQGPMEYFWHLKSSCWMTSKVSRLFFRRLVPWRRSTTWQPRPCFSQNFLSSGYATSARNSRSSDRSMDRVPQLAVGAVAVYVLVKSACSHAWIAGDGAHAS